MDGPDIQPLSAERGSLHERGLLEAQRRRGQDGFRLVRQLAYGTLRRRIGGVVVLMRTLRDADDEEREGDQDSRQKARSAPRSSGTGLVCHGSPSVPRIGAPAGPKGRGGGTLENAPVPVNVEPPTGQREAGDPRQGEPRPTITFVTPSHRF